MQQDMTAMQAYRASLAECIASQEKWQAFLDFAADFSMSDSQQPFGFAAQLCVYGSDFRSAVCLTEDDWAEYERYPVSYDVSVPVLSMSDTGSPCEINLFPLENTEIFDEDNPIPLPTHEIGDLAAQIQAALAQQYDLPTDMTLAATMREIIYQRLASLTMPHDAARFAENTMMYQLCKRYGIVRDSESMDFSYLDSYPSIIEIGRIGQQINKILFPLEQDIQTALETERRIQHERETGEDQWRSVPVGGEKSGMGAEIPTAQQRNVGETSGTGFGADDVLPMSDTGDRGTRGENGELTGGRIRSDFGGAETTETVSSQEESDLGGMRNDSDARQRTENGRGDSAVSGSSAENQGSGRLDSRGGESDLAGREVRNDENRVSPDVQTGAVSAAQSKRQSASTRERSVGENGENGDSTGIETGTERSGVSGSRRSVRLPENRGAEEQLSESGRGNDLAGNSIRIIGNADIREIPNRRQTQIDADIAVQVANQLESLSVLYSCAVEEDLATVTVSKENIGLCCAVISEVYAVQTAENVLPVAQPDELEQQNIEAVPETTASPEKKTGRRLENRAYKALQKLAPEMFNDDCTYLRFESDQFEPLVIERIDTDKISIAHYYEQNGDLMRDPEIVFTVDDEAAAIYPLEFTQDNLGIYEYYASYDRNSRDTLSFFTEDWSPNLEKQNHNLAKAIYDFNGSEVTVYFRPDGTISGADAESPEIAAAFLTSRNFSITDEKYDYRLSEESYGIGTKRERCHNNIEAIRTLKAIEAEGRMATPEEQEILAKYVGWGGIQEAFDSKNGAWETEYATLRELLTKDEYRAAEKTITDAFYTSPVVSGAIYEALENMGFHGGRILEPAMGIGNFFGTLPESMRNESQLVGVEIDSISGRIAQQLYQSADIRISGIEKTKFTNGSFDVAVGNVPFGDYKVSDRGYNKHKFLIHDYFFAKSLDKVKDGGIVAFVTSTGTMDKQNNKVRQYLAERADLIGAIRLPSKSFSDTDVSSDITYVEKYGILNSKDNSRAFDGDSRAPLLHSLEKVRNGKVVELAALFTQRTIIPHTVPTSADTAMEALAISISEEAKVNLDFMSSLLNKDKTEILSELQGVIYLNPLTEQYEMADEYLSGNIREKLAAAKSAAETDSRYVINIAALEQVMPEPLDASEIQVRLGATWMPVEYYQQFMKELFHTPFYYKIQVNFTPAISEYHISNKSADSSNMLVTTKYGTERKNAYAILEDCLNLRASTVYDPVVDADGKTKYIVNPNETESARQCQDALQEAFADWIFADSTRRNKLVTLYNEKFNSVKTVTDLQLAPEGTGYRAKTRFAEFFNLPELMQIFKEAADIKVASELNLDVPECEMHIESVPPTQAQEELIASLSKRADRVHHHLVSTQEDNMLCITTDGRKIGLDQRLINPLLPDDENTKVNRCISNVFKIWNETAEEKSTQIIFCDFSTPNGKGFNVYDDIKKKLIEKGVPANEIAFIHDAKTEEQKEMLFQKMRDGDIRVLLGSTAKMGTGTNVQDRLIASHDLDAPWRPADMTQRLGRMVRQGNTNKKVHLYRYVTERTFDAYLYQTLENKAKYIGQVMTAKSALRSCADVDDASLSYAEAKALCAGSPEIKEKMQLDIDVAKLRTAKSKFQKDQYRIEDRVLREIPQQLSHLQQRAAGMQADIEKYQAWIPLKDEKGEDCFSITIQNKVYTDREAAGKALVKAMSQAAKDGFLSLQMTIGSYKGFEMVTYFDASEKAYVCNLKGEISHRAVLGDSESGNLTRLENALKSMAENLISTQGAIKAANEELQELTQQMGKKFPLEEELAEKAARLSELNLKLTIAEHQDSNVLPVAQTDADQIKQQNICDNLIKQYPVDAIAYTKLNAEEYANLKKANLTIPMITKRVKNDEVIVQHLKKDDKVLKAAIQPPTNGLKRS